MVASREERIASKDRGRSRDSMKITLQEDLDPDPDFYYREQFKIYRDSFLIWDRETWRAVLGTCTVYRIEVDGKYAGDIIFQDRQEGRRYIVDFSILPEYQKRGIGKAVLEHLKKTGRSLTAVTREETLDFFVRCGFKLEKKMKNYYARGVDGYYLLFCGERTGAGSRRG